MASLARQVEELADDRPAAEVLERIGTLAARVDDIAQRVEIPESVMERLSGQMSLIASKLENEPHEPGSDGSVARHGGALRPPFAALESARATPWSRGTGCSATSSGGSEQVADRLEHHGAAATPADAGLVQAMEDGLPRFQRGWRQTSEPATDLGLAALAGDAPRRCLAAPGRPVATRSRRRPRDRPQSRGTGRRPVAATGKARAGDDGIRRDRLATRLIEQSIAGSREALLQAARKAAEEAVKSIAGSAGGQRGGRRACGRPARARHAGAPVGRAQREDLRGDPRHAFEDRRAAGLAGAYRAGRPRRPKSWP